MIDYEGGLNNQGDMVVEGYIQYYQNGTQPPFRGTWSQYPDDSARQLFEIQNQDGNWQI
ncbi:hypothetical protein [Alteromonas sediminis]|uniref:hypothetical protein n=1 Tax=Alteromonas sediminis TaxID=2259342 RepID=UPI00140510F6|nr:hypothetical protein [Alteromonas sediminis]